MIFPSTLDSSAFATIDVAGKMQLTYKGWPLYKYGQDAARGEQRSKFPDSRNLARSHG